LQPPSAAAAAAAAGPTGGDSTQLYLQGDRVDCCSLKAPLASQTM
jgi:hypothetical protein